MTPEKFDKEIARARKHFKTNGWQLIERSDHPNDELYLFPDKLNGFLITKNEEGKRVTYLLGDHIPYPQCINRASNPKQNITSAFEIIDSFPETRTLLNVTARYFENKKLEEPVVTVMNYRANLDLHSDASTQELVVGMVRELASVDGALGRYPKKHSSIPEWRACFNYNMYGSSDVADAYKAAFVISRVLSGDLDKKTYLPLVMEGTLAYGRPNETKLSDLVPNLMEKYNSKKPSFSQVRKDIYDTVFGEGKDPKHMYRCELERLNRSFLQN